MSSCVKFVSRKDAKDAKRYVLLFFCLKVARRKHGMTQNFASQIFLTEEHKNIFYHADGTEERRILCSYKKMLHTESTEFHRTLLRRYFDRRTQEHIIG